MGELEEVDEAILATTVFKGLPAEVLYHLGGVSRVAIAAVHEPSASALNALDLLG